MWFLVLTVTPNLKSSFSYPPASFSHPSTHILTISSYSLYTQYTHILSSIRGKNLTLRFANPWCHFLHCYWSSLHIELHIDSHVLSSRWKIICYSNKIPIPFFVLLVFSRWVFCSRYTLTLASHVSGSPRSMEFCPRGRNPSYGFSNESAQSEERCRLLRPGRLCGWGTYVGRPMTDHPRRLK